MFCENCGYKNNPEAKFCVGCGNNLENQRQMSEEYNKLNYNEDNIQLAKNNNVKSADGLAVASLVLGIVSLIIPYIGFILAIIGLILGGSSKTDCGIKKAGIILNIITMVILGIAIVSLLLWPSVEDSINRQWTNISSGYIYE